MTLVSALAAVLVQATGILDYTPVADSLAGDVIRLPDGRAAIVQTDLAASQLGSAAVNGIFDVKKTALIVMLPGQIAWWDISAGSVTYELIGDFPLGVVVAGAAAGDARVRIDLNATRYLDIDLARSGDFAAESALGLGVVNDGVGQLTLAFDAVAEAAQAALVSVRGIGLTGKPIFEGILANFDYGNNAALDLDFGLATGSHATDFEAVTNFASFHMDSALDLFVQSDDGTTDTAAVDTTVNLTDDTFAFFQIDARVPTAVKFYVNGIDKTPAGVFTLAAASTDLKVVVELEKTSDDTVADIRVRALRAYRAAFAA